MKIGDRKVAPPFDIFGQGFYLAATIIAVNPCIQNCMHHYCQTSAMKGVDLLWKLTQIQRG